MSDADPTEGVRSGPRGEPRVTQVQLTGRAMRFVQLLMELGHLDQDTANRVMVGVGELSRDHVADIAEVRRAAAMVLFPPDDQPSFEGLLAEDWPILFS